MYKNYKVIVNTAAGRRRYMQYLIPQVLACDIVDRYDLWLNTTNRQDLEFFRILAKKYSRINLVWQPDGIINGNASINAFYKQCTDDDAIYFKLDDDIVWLEDNLIKNMIKFRIDNPDYFLVSPLVINNSLSTYLLQIYGKLRLNYYHNSNPFSDVLWQSGKFAADLHNWFIDNYLRPQKTSHLHLGNGKNPVSMTRFSINSILWFGKDLKKIDGIIPDNDEEFMSCIYPTIQGKSNCWNTNALVAHFAFFTQRDYLDKEGILEKYGSFLKEQWSADTTEHKVYQDIIEAMKYVETNSQDLPQAPYTQVTKKNKYRLKNFIKKLYPVCVAQKIHIIRREKTQYITNI